MKKNNVLIIGGCVFLMLNCYQSVFAQHQTESDKIGFYKVALTANGAELLEVDFAPGRLKQRRRQPSPRGPYFFTVSSPAGDELWMENIGDPLNAPLEYIDEAGNLASKAVNRDTVIIYLRSQITSPGGTLKLFHKDLNNPQNASKAPRLVESFNISTD